MILKRRIRQQTAQCQILGAPSTAMSLGAHARIIVYVDGMYVSEHELDRRLRVMSERTRDATTRDALDVIWQYYEEATGTELNRPPLEHERAAIIEHLRLERAAGNWASLIAQGNKRPYLAFETPTAQASSLRSLFCNACELVQDADGSFPVYLSFHANVEPWTSQSRKDRVKIRESVQAEMQRREILEVSDHMFCITVVSLVRRTTRIQDVDNLVKGLLDSMEGVVYKNDRQIQCLTSRRVPYSGPSGGYFISARAVRPDSDSVIFDDGKPPIFM